MKRYTILLLALLTGLNTTSDAGIPDSTANQKKWSHYAHVGYNIGGAAPLSLPNTIRAINSYSPGLALSLAYELNYKINSKWSFSSGLRLDWKSMHISDSVQYFHTFITQDTAQFEGDFTGTNKTDCENVYLSIPVLANYHLDANWRFRAGLYFAFLVRPRFEGTVSNGYIRKGNSLGEKVLIDEASFDFKDEMRKFDMGLRIGAERKVYKNFAVSADLQWGLVPLFPADFSGMDFKMYNLFGNIGISYKFN